MPSVLIKTTPSTGVLRRHSACMLTIGGFRLKNSVAYHYI